MIDQNTTAQTLAGLIEDHLGEIIQSWEERVGRSASFSPGELRHTAFNPSTSLRAIVSDLRIGKYTALSTCLTQLSTTCWQRGFTNGEMTESLLLCRDAILPIIRRHAFDIDSIWSMIATLDECLRWMVRYFNMEYEAEANRRLRKQHEYIAAMLRMGVKNSELIDIDEVLRQVAEGIIAAADVDHCSFYMMDERHNRLIPRHGVSKKSPSITSEQYFMNHPPDLTTDLFLGELLERREPLVSYNAQIDPRVDRDLVETMGTKTVLAIPLVANDRVLAVALTGTFQDRRAFTDEQIELAWDVTRAAALVIENARLHQQIRHVAALEERERLAREIHDNLAQALSILKLQASNIDDLLRRGQIEQAQAFLAEMKATATEAHTDARETIFGLRHSSSSASEFLSTLCACLDRFRSVSGIDARLVAPDETISTLSTATVIQLTRVIQEALTNVRKHAGADAVVVQLEPSDGHLSVTVEDNGRGFDLDQVTNRGTGGVGLQIMRERAESVGGHLEVHTAPGRGTRVVAQIPLTSGR